MGKVSKILAGVCDATGSFNAGLLCNGLSGAVIEAISTGGVGAGLAALGLATGTWIPAACVLMLLGGTAAIRAVRASGKQWELEDRLKKIETQGQSTEQIVLAMREAIEHTGVRLHAEEELSLREVFAAARDSDLTNLSETTAHRILQTITDADLATTEHLSAIDCYTKEGWLRTLHIWEQQQADSKWIRDWEARLSAKLDSIKTDTALLPDIDARTKQIEKSIQSLSTGVRPGTATPTNLPDPSRLFASRARALLDLHDRLEHGGMTSLGQAAAVWADGGVGKTMLAEHYGWLHIDDYPFGVFKINSDSESLIPALAALAPFLGIQSTIPGSPLTPRPEADVATDVRAALQRGKSLLILDNVPSAERWADIAYTGCLPSLPCRRIITTRADYLHNIEMQHLDEFTPEEGATVLARHRVDAVDPANIVHARSVSEWFGGLGAGLLVVGVYMTLNPRVTWERYARELGVKGLTAARATHAHVESRITYHKRFDTAFDQALASLTELERAALEYAALLPESMVPVPWMHTLLDQDATNPKSDVPPGLESHAHVAIQHLLRLGLLRETQTHSQLLAMHNVLRETTLERLDAHPHTRTKRLPAIADCAAARRCVVIGTNPDGTDRGLNNPAAIERQELRWELAPLRAVCAELWNQGHPGSAARIGVWLAGVMRILGRYAEAAACVFPLSPSTEAAVESAIGPDGLAGVYSHRASIWQNQGDLPSARKNIERAIEIAEKRRGSEHPVIAPLRSNLAMIQLDQGDLVGARNNIDVAIQIDSKRLGPDDPTFGVRYSKLATIQQALGEFLVARQNMMRAIEIDSKYFAPDHPTFGVRYSNLATIQSSLGDFSAARQNMMRAIEIHSKHFAPNHPAFAANYNNLAQICFAEGDRRAARENLTKALTILLQHFDEDHPHVKITRNALKMIG